MSESGKRIPRRRGAQPGNRNAYKHGLYSARPLLHSAEAIARRRSISALIRSVRRQCAS